MHVAFRQNVGTIDAHKHGLDHKKCQIAMDANVSESAADALLASGVAVDARKADDDELIVSHREEQAKKATVKAVAKAPEIKGVEEESPVSQSNADEAIASIATMRSKDKLQHIIDNDTRVTVKEAAKKRLAAL